MNNFDFRNPTELIFGKGEIAKLPSRIKPDTRILMTYGGGSIFRNGIYNQVTEALKRSHPDIDFFLYGHRHIELDLQLTKRTRMMILGDWISQFTYAVYDGEHIFLGEYVEGESVM